jgi:flagellar biosynthesis protein FlhF
MRVKKFVASSMPEAMKMIRAELGNDAVILNSKVVHKGGFFGLFTKKNIEVIAAVDPKPLERPMHTTEKRKKQLDFLKADSASQHEKVNDFQLSVNNKTTKSTADLINEMNELKSMLKQLSTNVTTNFEQYPDPLKEINYLLIEQELSNELRQQLMAELLEKWYLQRGEVTIDQLLNWAKDTIISKLAGLSFGGITFEKKFINVVGPTGVGKTTTLAKMASECVIKHHKKVAFITTDTYRIAAIDQLKTYAKILDVPLEVCYNINDFRLAKTKFANYDVVLVDTAGRNFRNPQYVQDLREVIDFNEEMETYLVLALTAKEKDMKEIYEQFSLVKIDKFIFTKIDETSHYGTMLNLITECQTGVAYLTNGQNVPDDIVEATPEKVTNTVLGVE